MESKSSASRYPSYNFPLKIVTKTSFINKPLNMKTICFLFLSEAKIEDINIDTQKKIYPSGEIVKNEKKLNIYYIESSSSFSNQKIKIEIAKNSFNINLEKTEVDLPMNFLFDKYLFDKKDQKIGKLNCFDIFEEFDTYYRIHSEKNNKEYLKSLIKSSFNIIKYDEEKSNFSFFLTMLMKDSFNTIDLEAVNKNLQNIKNKGDLTKISKDELYHTVITKERIGKIMILIYLILSEQKFEEIKGFLMNNGLEVEELFKCLEEYKNLFLHSLKLSPKYNYLFEISDSLYQIKTILKCSNSLTDFIYSLNENKENIENILFNKKKYAKNKNKNLLEEKEDDIFFLKKKQIYLVVIKI